MSIKYVPLTDQVALIANIKYNSSQSTKRKFKKN